MGIREVGAGLPAREALALPGTDRRCSCSGTLRFQSQHVGSSRSPHPDPALLELHSKSCAGLAATGGVRCEYRV